MEKIKTLREYTQEYSNSMTVVYIKVTSEEEYERFRPILNEVWKNWNSHHFHNDEPFMYITMNDSCSRFKKDQDKILTEQGYIILSVDDFFLPKEVQYSIYH